VAYNTEDADAVSASVSEILSNDYDIIKESFTLDCAGSCIKIDASEAKDGSGTPDLINTLKYYGTWQADEFSEKYSGGSSLSRID